MEPSAAVSSITEQCARYLALLDLQPGEVALEAGCGGGRALAIARGRLPRTRWVGLDRVARFLEQAREACPGVPLARGDLCQLPFAASSLDAVFSRDTLECLPDPVRHLDECARVLRPGGRLLLAHWDWDTQVFNCADLALTRTVVRAYADAQQGWMEHHDPAMGRKLHGLVGRHAGLDLIDAGATVLLDHEWRPGGFGYEQSQTMARFLPARGLVAEADVRRWLELIKAAAAAGDYLCSANHYWCLARKRGA